MITRRGLFKRAGVLAVAAGLLPVRQKFPMWTEAPMEPFRSIGKIAGGNQIISPEIVAGEALALLDEQIQNTMLYGDLVHRVHDA